MWPFRTPAPADPDELSGRVADLLQVEASCAELTSAANRWAASASAHGATVQEVSTQLDAWAARHEARSRAAAVRIGLRLHPASRVRVR